MPVPRKEEARFLRKARPLALGGLLSWKCHSEERHLRETPDLRQEESIESQRPPGMSPFAECPRAPQNLWLQGMASWLIRLFKHLSNDALSGVARWKAWGSGCMHLSRHFHLQRITLNRQTSRSLSVFICNTGQQSLSQSMPDWGSQIR